jgi:hypothetical protein
MLFVCGIPLLFMEFAIGQYTRLGPIGAMAKICPFFKGNFNFKYIRKMLLPLHFIQVRVWPQSSSLSFLLLITMSSLPGPVTTLSIPSTTLFLGRAVPTTGTLKLVGTGSRTTLHPGSMILSVHLRNFSSKFHNITFHDLLTDNV